MLNQLQTNECINGLLLKQQRELKEISRFVLATKFCCSVKQIEELEEGGNRYFYSQYLKIKLAKKIANYFNVPESELFLNGIPEECLEASSEFVKKFNKNNPVKSNRFSFQTVAAVLGVLFLGGFLFLNVGVSESFYQESIAKSNTFIQASNPSIQEKLNDRNIQTSPLQVVSDKKMAVCDLPINPNASFTPVKANLIGNVVVFVSKTDQQLCLIDSQNTRQLVTMKAGEKRILQGLAPFTVLAEDVTKFDTYYQGWRVDTLTKGMNSIILKETMVTKNITPNIIKPVIANTPVKKSLESPTLNPDITSTNIVKIEVAGPSSLPPPVITPPVITPPVSQTSISE